MTKLFVEETVVVPLLTKMCLPRWALLEILTSVAGERANVAPGEPPTVPGYESWRWGTRYLRENRALRDLGWVSCDKDQVHGIRNAALGFKLVICNTDSNTGSPNLSKSPKNVGERGPAGVRLIRRNSTQTKMHFIEDDPQDDLWYLCQWFNEKMITAEVSRPESELGGIVSSWSDRIIISKPGDMPGIRRRIDIQEDFAAVPRPQISRKLG